MFQEAIHISITVLPLLTTVEVGKTHSSKCVAVLLRTTSIKSIMANNIFKANEAGCPMHNLQQIFVFFDARLVNTDY